MVVDWGVETEERVPQRRQRHNQAQGRATAPPWIFTKLNGVPEGLKDQPWSKTRQTSHQKEFKVTRRLKVAVEGVKEIIEIIKWKFK